MKYKAIAEQIITDIKSQKLAQGQRLPSLRHLSKQLGVSMTTAVSSYRSLEQMGWVVTQPKSGFFVSTPLSHGHVPTQPQFRSSSRRLPSALESKVCTNDLITSGPFGISQLSPRQVPLVELKRSIKRTVQRSDDLLSTYSDPQGNQQLRQALAEHFSSRGFALAADEIFISNGCMDAIRKALLITTKPGDAVAISSPCFNGLLQLLSSLSRRVVEIPSNAEGVDLMQLEQKFKDREVGAALLSSSHMNPHGISLSVTQKQTLATLANKYRVPIIEDDVYGELGYQNAFPLPIKHWDTNGYVLWCSSISKTLASGLRVGWCSAGRYLEACTELSAIEHLGHNGVMQASLADFINAGQYRKHVCAVKKIILSNTGAYRHLLLRTLPHGAAVSAPSGGLVLWVQVPGLNDTKLRKLTEDAGLDVRFGAEFTTRKLYRDCFRINVGWALAERYDSHRSIEDALLQLAACVRAALSNGSVNKLNK